MGRRSDSFTEDDKHKLILLIGRGHNTYQIAIIMRRSTTTISGWASRLGCRPIWGIGGGKGYWHLPPPDSPVMAIKHCTCGNKLSRYNQGPLCHSCDYKLGIEVS